jgi:UDP:flavonoid glycosyltransferase YjiC (YdhE family)
MRLGCDPRLGEGVALMQTNTHGRTDRDTRPGKQTMRILMFAEGVTLAHVARPLALAPALIERGHEVHLACPAAYQGLAAVPGLRVHALDSISAKAFMAALAAGRPVYDVPTLDRYVDTDLRLIGEIGPDVIVGDFRLSLSVSARRARRPGGRVGVPYLTITNAYWSPYTRVPFELPVLPFTRWVPLPLAAAGFRLVGGSIMARHCRPLNAVRRRHGLPPLGGDLRRVYCDADEVVYADLPSMFPSAPLPPHHRFVGPIYWAPGGRLPDWWGALPADRPVVYATLGSSGHASVLDQVLQALAGTDCHVIASTAGAAAPADGFGDNVHLAPFLPGDLAAARANLVICNGGSMTCQQAMKAGRPVLGIASNMDQFMNMSGVERIGAGRRLRADRLDADTIRHACRTLREEPAFRGCAAEAAAELARFDAPREIAERLESLART